MQITELAQIFAKWVNENQGVLSVALFLITATFGVISWIFSSLRRKPIFEISTIAGPTFCCTYLTGNKHYEYDAHQTGIAIYLVITNIGSAPSSIKSIAIGYHWDLTPWSIIWLKNSVGWFWLNNQAVALTDFQVSIGDSIKVYPFLTQKNYLSPANQTHFIEIGQSTNGVVYFEQPESWGGCYPKVQNKLVNIKVRVTDVFGKQHTTKVQIPSVSFEEARKYNPEFGNTFSKINGSACPNTGVENI
ncbi:hypothetical protein D9M69_534900 [compost metagenome]